MLPSSWPSLAMADCFLGDPNETLLREPCTKDAEAHQQQGPTEPYRLHLRCWARREFLPPFIINFCVHANEGLQRGNNIARPGFTARTSDAMIVIGVIGGVCMEYRFNGMAFFRVPKMSGFHMVGPSLEGPQWLPYIV